MVLSGSGSETLIVARQKGGVLAKIADFGDPAFRQADHRTFARRARCRYDDPIARG
jgi:hypothetical protein